MRSPAAIRFFTLTVIGAAVGAASGQETAQKHAAPTKDGVEFFEKYIRPVLAESCYECHSAQARKLKGKLLLDSQAGVIEGACGQIASADPQDALSAAFAVIEKQLAEFGGESAVASPQAAEEEASFPQAPVAATAPTSRAPSAPPD